MIEMAKIRDYTYGSPKFEREINKAVSDGGTVEGSDIKSTGETSGKVLTANGSGGASWETASGGGSVYRHKIEISARDANYTTYYFGIILYSTNATPIFGQSTPTITDVVNFITPLVDREYFQTPSYIIDGTEYHFALVEGGIEGTSLVYNTGESGRTAITAITSASDIVAEV